MYLGELEQLFGRVFFGYVVFSHIIIYKGIDAHLALGLVAVGGKPAYAVILIHDIEIVVADGVKRHTDVFGFEIRLCCLVVAGHEYVEASNTLLALGGKI